MEGGKLFVVVCRRIDERQSRLVRHFGEAMALDWDTILVTWCIKNLEQMVSLSVLRHCVVGAACVVCECSFINIGRVTEDLASPPRVLSVQQSRCSSTGTVSYGPTNECRKVGTGMRPNPDDLPNQQPNPVSPAPLPTPARTEAASGVRLRFGVSGSIVAACLPATNKDDLIFISRVWPTSERGYQSMLFERSMTKGG